MGKIIHILEQKIMNLTHDYLARFPLKVVRMQIARNWVEISFQLKHPSR